MFAVNLLEKFVHIEWDKEAVIIFKVGRVGGIALFSPSLSAFILATFLELCNFILARQVHPKKGS